MKHYKLTSIILKCSFEVSNELGAGFLETVYENALLQALRLEGLQADNRYPLEVFFRGRCIGKFYADLFVEQKVIVELKAVKAIEPIHQAQVLNYLNASGIEVGLLINFGRPKLEYMRFNRSKNHHVTP
ncbi:MAG: GxxExxY protein [Calditrichia bacterium]